MISTAAGLGLLLLCLSIPVGAETTGNRVNDIAGHATVVEGGIHRVQATSVAVDSAAVAQMLDRFISAFNDLDWERFREHFADDATVFFPMRSGMRADGRAELEAVFGPLFRSGRTPGSGPPYLNIRPRDLRIQMLSDAAIATFHLGADDDSSVGRRTLVLRRGMDGVWRIVHLHASALDRGGAAVAE